MIFTVGNEKVYDELLFKYGSLSQKAGRSKEYEGGCVFKKFEDAREFLIEINKLGEWAIYVVDANWRDTEKSQDGWYNILLEDSKIVCKIN